MEDNFTVFILDFGKRRRRKNIVSMSEGKQKRRDAKFTLFFFKPMFCCIIFSQDIFKERLVIFFLFLAIDQVRTVNTVSCFFTEAAPVGDADVAPRIRTRTREGTQNGKEC